jgi:hypothetical protein
MRQVTDQFPIQNRKNNTNIDDIFIRLSTYLVFAGFTMKLAYLLFKV